MVSINIMLITYPIECYINTIIIIIIIIIIKIIIIIIIITIIKGVGMLLGPTFLVILAI